MNQPLAELLRPQRIEDVVGQKHLIGPDGPLTRLLQNKYLPSIIFWGPPGVGKTTLAFILARTAGHEFVELSGVDFSVKSLEAVKPKRVERDRVEIFAGTEDSLRTRTVVFIDEIHRLNKSQQAQFLPYVERGDWVLIGATTENPSFEVISPLLSRAQVLVLNALKKEDLDELIGRGLKKLNFDSQKLKLTRPVRDFLIRISNGDARLLLNSLQALHGIFAGTTPKIKEVEQALGSLHLVYDKHGDEHYDTISALIKSMRGSDPNAAVYYMTRMLEGGEDPVFIARRCTILASEDIGNADPQALVLANAAFDAVKKLGMPESALILSQLVIYLAQAPKSNQATLALMRARHDIQKYGNLPVPLKLRNAPTSFMQEIGYGKDYKYAHDYSPEELAGEQYLPDKLKDRDYLKNPESKMGKELKAKEKDTV